MYDIVNVKENKKEMRRHYRDREGMEGGEYYALKSVYMKCMNSILLIQIKIDVTKKRSPKTAWAPCTLTLYTLDPLHSFFSYLLKYADTVVSADMYQSGFSKETESIQCVFYM